MVADSIRNQILMGRLEEGDMLPRQRSVGARYGVSPPTVREALRILETEGLVTVRRGHAGGAVVHRPTRCDVAYSISLALQLQKVPLDTLGAILRRLEQLCATMCAERVDRHETVLPALSAAVEEELATIDDERHYALASRRFHDTLVASCGNETISLVTGSLEFLWRIHDHDGGQEASRSTSDLRLSAVRAHQSLINAIDVGDSEVASQLAERHLAGIHAITDSSSKRRDVLADGVRGVGLEDLYLRSDRSSPQSRMTVAQ